MFNIFKRKKAVVETRPVPETKRTIWSLFKGTAIKEDGFAPSEPWTLAQERLKGGAHDIGAARALRMYNTHKTKVQNQWINPLQSVNSGFGNAQDSFYMYQTVNYYQCYILAQDPLFTKVFNMLSRTPFSKGGQLTVPDDMPNYDKEALETAVKKYRLWDEVREGVRSSYVTGGCLVYLDFGLTEQERSEPLNLRKINCRKFRGFRHIDPINITAVNVNTIDPAADDYMKPELWYVIGLGVVHRSHFIQFEANPPERPMRPLTLYFGMPLTQLIKQDVANSNLVSQGVANLINRSRYVYLKADSSDFATDNASQFRDRLEYMSYSQDNFGVCPLKNTEDVLQLTTSLTGFAENVEQAYLLISAKTDIPFTELMGKSASGMNATGEGDRRKWYDKCRTIQEDNKRNILTMYGIVAGKIADDGKYIEFPDYVFDPLEEATEKELADNIKAYTDVATALAGLGANPDSLIEWLKQFKQFHLDSIEFDTSTPGLDGYDDDDPNGGGGMPDITGGADLGDGFKAREDITPKVIAALRAMNAKKDASGHMHDDATGQFTSGGDSGFNKPGDKGSSGKISVRGNELAGFGTTGDALRTAAVDYYKKNLAGTTVKHHELGDVLFSQSGYKKPVSFSADERKLRLFPFLPEIIKTGKVVQTEKDRYNRPQVDGWVVLESKITYKGEDTSVRVNLRKDSNGRLYYDHVISKTLGGTAYNDSQSKGVNNSIGQDEQIVNLFILSQE